MMQRAGLYTTNLLVPILENGLQQQRGMASLKAIKMKLKSVQAIQKITRSMKMVSAAKYAVAERELKHARPFGLGSKKFYEQIDFGKEKIPNPKKLLIPVTSDRGLAGAVHGNVCRDIRKILAVDSANTKIFCIGDKSRAILRGYYAKHIIMVADKVGRRPPSFLDASKIAKAILTRGYDYTQGKLVYNKFKSISTYHTSRLPVYSARVIEKSEKIVNFDSLDTDVIESYLEFSLASLIYYALKESAAAEHSARMAAMDNATRNAGQMLHKYTLKYNRTRQAAITIQLVEIISGAAALK